MLVTSHFLQIKKVAGELNIEAKLIEAGGNSNIEKAIENALEQNDSIGGIVECVVSNLPVGLGEPFFDSVEAVISHLVFSIPAIKGVEFGSGFQAARMKGSKHNDAIVDKDGTTASNFAGGINGGLTNGNNLVFRVAGGRDTAQPLHGMMWGYDHKLVPYLKMKEE